MCAHKKKVWVIFRQPKKNLKQFWVARITQWKTKQVLHIDPWQSRFLSTEHIRVNKRKQSHGLTEMWGHYEMIYADAHVWYSQFWFSYNLRPEETLSRRAPVNGLAPCWGSVPKSDPQWASDWILPSREAKVVLSGALKKRLWYGQKKK